MSFSPNEFIEHLNFCPSKGDISQRFNSPNPTLNFQQKINSSHHQNSNQTNIHNRTQSNSHKNNSSHFDSNQPSNVNKIHKFKNKKIFINSDKLI